MIGRDHAGFIHIPLISNDPMLHLSRTLCYTNHLERCFSRDSASQLAKLSTT